MDESLFDDVNSLLEGDFGDDRILKQIHRACKNNEVISNYERNYVQKLAEQYLGKKPQISSPKKPEITTTIPDVIMPQIQPSVQAQKFEPTPNNFSKPRPKNLKLFLGFGGIILITVVAAALLFSTMNSTSDPITSNPVTEIKVPFSVQTDLSEYGPKDLISINGVSPNSDLVNLSIKNQDNQLIWAEQVSVKNSGMYSTLAIAGGSGWENYGNYTLEVNDGFEIKSVVFLFTS